MKFTKTNGYLLAILVLALVLRIIIAGRNDVGPDEMVYSVIPLNIISAKALGTIEQSPVYFYTADLGYKLFGGITAISTRLPSIIFGSLAVLVIFLVTSELFNRKKEGLLASFLFAVSIFALKNNVEMDMMAYFLVILSMYFFLCFLRGKNWSIYFSAALFSLAVLVKNIVIIFIPAYLISLIVYDIHHGRFLITQDKKIILNKSLLRTFFWCTVLFFLIITPVFIYNYLLYTEKGNTDYYFSVVLGIGETLHKGLQGKSWSFLNLGNFLKELFLVKMPITLITGILGFFVAFRRNKYGSSLLAVSALALVLYLGGKTASPSHYLWLPIIFSIFSAAFIVFIVEKFMEKPFQKIFSQNIYQKYFFTVLICLILLFSLINLRGLITKTSATVQLNNFVQKQIPEDSVIVIDPRIYRGIHAWVFNERHYLEGTLYPQLNEMLRETSGQQRENIPIYYIECGKGTNCGWKEEDFERIYDFSEQLSESFRSKLNFVAQIKEVDTFNIYRGSFTTPPTVYDIVDQTHFFWFYSVGWKNPEMNGDFYVAKGFGKILENIGLLILYLDVFAALGTIPLVFFLLRKDEEKELSG